MHLYFERERKRIVWKHVLVWSVGFGIGSTIPILYISLNWDYFPTLRFLPNCIVSLFYILWWTKRGVDVLPMSNKKREIILHGCRQSVEPHIISLSSLFYFLLPIFYLFNLISKLSWLFSCLLVLWSYPFIDVAIEKGLWLSFRIILK